MRSKIAYPLSIRSKSTRKPWKIDYINPEKPLFMWSSTLDINTPVSLVLLLRYDRPLCNICKHHRLQPANRIQILSSGGEEWCLRDRSRSLLRLVLPTRIAAADLMSVPDIKAYLCLLGTDDNRIAWFHRDDDGDPTKPLSAEVERLRDACNQAVRRGAERLVKRQKEGRG